MAEHASRQIDRRRLLRSAGVLGGAAAIAAVGGAVGTPAQAADGDDLLVGASNSASSATGLTITAGSTPTLTLTNTNGPQLNLAVADDFTGDLAVGDIANTSVGPTIGVDYGDGDGVQNDVLVTGDDLNYLVPMPIAIAPYRLLDTRDSSTRAAIVRKESGAVNSAGQLVAGHWIDIAIGDSNVGFTLGGVFFNVTAVSPLTDGYAAVYVPSVGNHPSSSTVNFHKGITIANGGFGAVETYNNSFVVRVYASATTHLIFDLTGAVISETMDDSDAAKTRTRVLTRAARSRARTMRMVAKR